MDAALARYSNRLVCSNCRGTMHYPSIYQLYAPHLPSCDGTTRIELPAEGVVATRLLLERAGLEDQRTTPNLLGDKRFSCGTCEEEGGHGIECVGVGFDKMHGHVVEHLRNSDDAPAGRPRWTLPDIVCETLEVALRRREEYRARIKADSSDTGP